MEWISLILPGLVGVVVVPAALYLIGLFMPRRITYSFGYRIGRLLTGFGQKRMGHDWEQLEDSMKSTVSDFVEGVYEGLDSDDPQTA